MAYSDFTVSSLETKFGIKFEAHNLFPTIETIEPSNWLMEGLEIGLEIGYYSEKSRAERLISPILLEIYRNNRTYFSIHSGMDLKADEANGLNGECDFIFSASKIQDFVATPIFCITEAKKQDIELGTIQCAAQLVGAKKLNETKGDKIDVLYGCSTSGEVWRFLKYENNTIFLDTKRYLLDNVPKILGILQEIINNSKNGI